jgi:hypothetical protein
VGEGISVDLQDVADAQQDQIHQLSHQLVIQAAYIRRLERERNDATAQVSQLIGQQISQVARGVTSDEEPMRA